MTPSPPRRVASYYGRAAVHHSGRRLRQQTEPSYAQPNANWRQRLRHMSPTCIGIYRSTSRADPQEFSLHRQGGLTLEATPIEFGLIQHNVLVPYPILRAPIRRPHTSGRPNTVLLIARVTLARAPLTYLCLLRQCSKSLAAQPLR